MLNFWSMDPWSSWVFCTGIRLLVVVFGLLSLQCSKLSLWSMNSWTSCYFFCTDFSLLVVVFDLLQYRMLNPWSMNPSSSWGFFFAQILVHQLCALVYYHCNIGSWIYYLWICDHLFFFCSGCCLFGHLSLLVVVLDLVSL